MVVNGSRTYFHETTIGFRREPVPVSVTSNTDAVLVDREADVFKYWLQDTEDSIEKTVDLDYGYSKLENILKTPEDISDLRFMLIGSYEYLKDLFLTLTINTGNFPYLSAQNFTRFMKDCKVLDKVITGSRMDQLLIAVRSKRNSLDKMMPNQGPADFNRTEFIEALVRVAILKFKEHAAFPGKISITTAFEKLISDKIKPNIQPAPWQQFRDEELWTREVNLVFHDNSEGLHTLFDKYKDKQIGRIPYLSAVELLCVDCSIKLDKYDAIYCYAMSLSTCVDLFKAANYKLMHITYEEFLEMIARASDLHFQDTTSEGLALWEKIMLVLDELLHLVEDYRPVMPRWTEEEEEAESDPENMQVPIQRIKMMKSDIYSTKYGVQSRGGLASHGDNDDVFK